VDFFSSLFGFFITFLLQIILNKDELDTMGISTGAPLALGVFEASCYARPR
jgi:hypothetical protein